MARPKGARMTNARRPWIAGALALALCTTAAAAQDVDADTVVATVGGTEITLGHLIVAKANLPEQFRQMPNEMLLPGLIDQLVQQEALAQSLGEVSKATELTIDNQRSGLLAGEALGRVVSEAVTEDAIREAYDTAYADAEPSREFNAAHILVETEEEAAEVIAELEAGADFATLAQQRSTGPSGPRGGALGWFEGSQMVPAFGEAVAAMEPGEISAPVQTEFGWHVVLLNDTRMTEAPPLEQVRGQLAEEVRSAAMDAHIAAVLEQTEVDRPELEIDPALLDDLSLVSP
jgi:peptidyl-prolyl cis-trans isomerase C